jgi:serine/threonine protein phosphatase 1
MFLTQISGPVLAVADLHGAYEQVKTLLDFLVANQLHEGRWLIFLGDYVDGPDTACTIELLLSWNKLHPQTTFLCGNHDLSLAKGLGLVQSPHQTYYAARIPTRNTLTLASYGARDAAELVEKMPQADKDFLKSLPWVIEHPDYLFVHAGLDASEPVEQQLEQLRARDTRVFKPKWLHETTLAWASPADTIRSIVSGHTILRQPFLGDGRILLDTGCGYGGPLTACLLPERVLIQIPTRVGKTKSYQGAYRPLLENENAARN